MTIAKGSSASSLATTECLIAALAAIKYGESKIIHSIESFGVRQTSRVSAASISTIT